MSAPVLTFSVRIVMSAVLALAATAKLRDLSRFEDFLHRLGTPAPSLVRIIVPLTELLLAFALLFGESARPALTLSAALFLVFTAVLIASVLHGKDEACQCFGNLLELRAGWPAVIRSAALAALCIGTALFDDGALGVGQLPAPAVVPVLILTATVLLAGPEIMYLRRRVADLEQRLDAARVATSSPPVHLQSSLVGATVPAFYVLDLDGKRVDADLLKNGTAPVMLVFADVRCGPCRTLLPRVAEWQRSHSEVRFAIIGRGTQDELREWKSRYDLIGVYQQGASDVRARFGITGTPGAVLIGSNGVITHPVAAGTAAIEALVQKVARADPNGQSDNRLVEARREKPLETPSVATASALADLRFPTASGSSTAVCGNGTRSRLLIFWSEDCPSCYELLRRMSTGVLGGGRSAPDIMVVAIGSFRAKQLNQLPWPVVLDPTFTSRRVLGVSGTPSALLVAPDCTPEAPMAVGAAAVAALARL
jgi:uncharacterized membrane protein YphA (DoxX/SURF4 family)